MTKKHLYLFALLNLLQVFGCTLTEPSECIPGREKCDSDVLLGGGISYICTDSGYWLPLQTCIECQDSVCLGESLSNLHCDNEGEASCLDLELMSVQFDCIQNRLIPTICGKEQKCENGKCSGFDHDCSENAKSCVWLSELEVAVMSICKDNQLQTMYCDGGFGCNGDVCASEFIQCINTGEILDKSTNSCVCDASGHWTGEAGSCDCESGYHNTGDTCEEYVECNKPGEILDESNNICVCDTSGHWTGEVGSCKCAKNYLNIDNVCEKAVSCSGKGVVRDDATNTCVCNATAQWTGDAGSCECKEDYAEYYIQKTAVCCKTRTPSVVTPCVDMENLSVGDICSFGEYKQINNNENKQPIEWRVFKVDGTKGAFLISEYVLETKPYNKTKIDVSWETCTLRSWLNGLGPENNTDGVDYSESNFIDTAFSTTEKSYINNITHTNSYNGNSVEDKVFLLDYAEISVYKLGVKYGTSYYCNANTMIDVTVCRWDEAHDFQFPVGWWIRSQKNDMNYATTVSVRGNTGTYSVNAGKLGVLPALWFKK